MRTLHIDSGREMQGGQWQAIYLIERLRGAILLARQGSPLFVEAAGRGIDVRPLSLKGLAAAAGHADLVHAHDARAHTMAALTGTMLAANPPLVVSRRVAFPVKRSRVSRWKYGRAALFLAVSRSVAERLEDAGVSRERIRVVYDGVPVPLAAAAPQAGRVVALVSKPVEIPGISVDLTRNLWQDLATASVFVYKSELEGLGSAALAAMAMGVPLVASSVGGLPEVVEHERTGILVHDGDFATPVRRLLADPEWARRMGRAGRERVQNKFSVEVMVEATVAAYREVCRGLTGGVAGC